MEGQRVLYVISHTHWDREWYQTFQQYRRRMVFLIDELLDTLETDAEYRVFHLDGQTILLEDYLEIRPHARARLERLIRDGRIVVGPWYVMPDEFLVSGESLVRNLARGRELSRAFGAEPMSVGYVVDVFGHASQMPQLFRGFGIGSAVLFRGIGDYPKDLFRWLGADGSELLTAKLDPDRCYSNFYFALRWPFDGRPYEEEELVRRASELFKMMEDRAVSHNLPMMDGVDHIEIEPELPRLLDLIRRRFPDTIVHHTRLEEYFDAQSRAIAAGELTVGKLEQLRGRLYRIGRRGLNNRVLKNTLSSMVHLKQANDECEILLTRLVEPFLGLLPAAAAAGYDGFVREAWRLLMHNHPHDSICGCSITAVHQDNEHRFKQAREIAADVLGSLHRDLLPATSRRGDERRAVLRVYNAGQSPIEGLVEADLRLDPACGENVRLHDRDANPLPLQVLGVEHDVMDVETQTRRLPRFIRSTVMRVVFPASLPPVGYADFEYEQLPSRPPDHGEYAFNGFSPPARPQGTLRRGPGRWETDFFVIEESPGGLSLTDKVSGRTLSPLFWYEDDGDTGDGWNYVPPSAGDQRFSTRGLGAPVTVEADGPLAVRLRVDHTMVLPSATEGLRRSDARTPLEIRTTLTFLRDRPLVSAAISLTNTCAGHRLRLLVPAPFDARHFHHATPFALDRSEIGREDDTDSMEPETGVLPNQGVIVLSDSRGTLGLYNRGLYECEVIDGDDLAVAVTLLRSFASEVGRSRGEMSFLLRPLSYDVAFDFGEAGVTPEQMLVRGADWRCGLRSLCGAPPPTPASPPVAAALGEYRPSRSLLRLDGPVVLSSVRHRDDGTMLVRVFNPGVEPASAEFTFESSVRTITPLMPDEETPDSTVGTARVRPDTVRLNLRGAAICTVAVILEGS